MRVSTLLAAAAAIGLGHLPGPALQRDQFDFGKALRPSTPGWKQLRPTSHGRTPSTAGRKLRRQAAKGKLGIAVIR